MRISPGEFRKLDLVVHGFLADVPLHDVSAIDLPGGGEGRKVVDVRSLFVDDPIQEGNGLTRFLFSLRWRVGAIFGWDRQGSGLPEDSYVHRWARIDGGRSLIAPGTKDGPFHVVYHFPSEALSEIRNATVHAFLCSALVPRAEGYRLYWAVFVTPVSRWTTVYLAMIEPFRRFIVYPSLLRRIRRAWTARYGAAGTAARSRVASDRGGGSVDSMRSRK
jgi:hypothetical protein